MKKQKLKLSAEQKRIIKKLKEEPRCHSFWKSECMNRNIECHRCSEFYADKEKKKASIIT